jgi:hypothetical protein
VLRSEGGEEGLDLLGAGAVVLRGVARAGEHRGELGDVALGGVGAGEQPVGDGELVDDVCEEVVGRRPVGVFSVDRTGEGAAARQGPDQGQDPPRGQLLPVEVKEIDAVVPEKVGFDRLGVLL